MSGSPFELEPDGQSDPPDLPGKAMVFASDEEAIAAAIRELHSAADTAVRERGRFHLAVSGNVSLEPMWAQLMIDPDLRMFPWPQTHLWITASEADRSSTQRRVQESLILPSGIPAEQVHAMLGGEPDELPPIAHPLDAAVLSAEHNAPPPDVFDLLCAARTLLVVGLGQPIERSSDLAELASIYEGDLRWYIIRS
jgi:6-phosphogluconolactonase/glucosamine-6-phosphate isomerase/deaminase